jgi:hypothetical protein
MLPLANLLNYQKPLKARILWHRGLDNFVATHGRGGRDDNGLGLSLLSEVHKKNFFSGDP